MKYTDGCVQIKSIAISVTDPLLNLLWSLKFMFFEDKQKWVKGIFGTTEMWIVPYDCYFFPLWSQLDRSTREVELGLEYGPPVMNIGGQSWKFEDGQWVTGKDLDYAEQRPSYWLLPELECRTLPLSSSCMCCYIYWSLNGQHRIYSCFFPVFVEPRIWWECVW